MYSYMHPLAVFAVCCWACAIVLMFVSVWFVVLDKANKRLVAKLTDQVYEQYWLRTKEATRHARARRILTQLRMISGK